MVGKLDGFGPVADAILDHHERVDGGGYPAGLIGNEIPLAARIVAICSAYDRMLRRDDFGHSDDPGRGHGGFRRGAGSQFDADLVDAFDRDARTQGPVLRAGRRLQERAGVRDAGQEDGRADHRPGQAGTSAT